jgi:anthranilate phosphoribosyltransferase
MEQGVRKAGEAIASGAARAKLDQLVEFSNRFK